MSENINGGQNLWEIEIISEYQILCLNNNSWQLKKIFKVRLLWMINQSEKWHLAEKR